MEPLCAHAVAKGMLKCYPGNFSGFAPGEGVLTLAGYPQLLAAASGGYGANVSEGTLITRVRR